MSDEQMQSTKKKDNFWLKLPSNFFDSKQIKKLLKNDKYHSAILFYIRLMAITIPTEGNYLLDGFEDTIEEELSLDFDIPVEKIKKYLEVLEKIELIAIKKDIITVPFVVMNVGKKDISNDRVARYRQRKRESGNDGVTECNDLCNDGVTECNGSIFKEDVKQELHTDKKQDTKQKTIGKRDYILLFESRNWFDRFKYPRDKRAMRRWLTYLEEKGTEVAVIPPTSWETKLKKLVEYCEKGFDLGVPLDLAIEKCWENPNIGQQYSLNRRRSSIAKELLDKRKALHEKIKSQNARPLTPEENAKLEEMKRLLFERLSSKKHDDILPSIEELSR